MQMRDRMLQHVVADEASRADLVLRWMLPFLSRLRASQLDGKAAKANPELSIEITKETQEGAKTHMAIDLLEPLD